MGNGKAPFALVQRLGIDSHLVAEHRLQQRQQPFIQGEAVEVDVLAVATLLESLPAGLGNAPIAAQFILDGEPLLDAIITRLLVGQGQMPDLVQQGRREQRALQAQAFIIETRSALHQNSSRSGTST